VARAKRYWLWSALPVMGTNRTGITFRWEKPTAQRLGLGVDLVWNSMR
jgi:hypothetical protein